MCRFLSLQTVKIRSCLDGKNLETVLNDLGVRFHRVIYEHFQQFQYNSMGQSIIIVLTLKNQNFDILKTFFFYSFDYFFTFFILLFSTWHLMRLLIDLMIDRCAVCYMRRQRVQKVRSGIQSPGSYDIIRHTARPVQPPPRSARKLETSLYRRSAGKFTLIFS